MKTYYHLDYIEKITNMTRGTCYYIAYLTEMIPLNQFLDRAGDDKFQLAFRMHLRHGLNRKKVKVKMEKLNHGYLLKYGIKKKDFEEKCKKTR